MMTRFFGMMPISEVALSKKFIDENGLTVLIQAGTGGWTIIFADTSTSYEDCEDSVQNNFNKAIREAESVLGKIIPC